MFKMNLKQKIRNESEFSLEQILASPEESGQILSWLRPEETVQALSVIWRQSLS